jgi:hypothetical protein
VEAPANGELNDGGGHDEDPIDALHAEEEPRLQHERHRAKSEGGGNDPVTEKSARLFGARGDELGIERFTRRLCVGVAFASGKGECCGGHFVSCSGNDGGKIGNARCFWRVLDGGHRGGKVHARAAHTICLLQESLHAVHARGAGHAGDGEGNLRHGGRWCRRNAFG